MQFGGGYNWNITGPSYGTGAFENLELSQGFIGKKWSLGISDGVSYTPQAPTLGFTGIPGIGEPVATPSPNPPVVNPPILTLNTYSLGNSASASFNRRLNYAWSANMSGNYDLLIFPDGNGLDTDTTGANGGLSYRLSARDSLIGNYQFSKFTYPDYLFSFYTHSVFFGFTRQWSRRLSTDISAGPQWTSSSNSMLVPSSTGAAVNASVNYLYGFNKLSANYQRGVSAGGGYLIGSQTDSAGISYLRKFGNTSTLGFDFGYSRFSGLINNGVTNAKYGGAQATHQLGRNFQVFANYSAIAQSTSSQLPVNTLGTVIQIVGFGIGYSPRERGSTR